MAEGSGLLNRQTLTGLVGSNPTSSANTESAPKGAFSVCAGGVTCIGTLRVGSKDGMMLLCNE